MASSDDITTLLVALRSGRREALQELTPIVYDELRGLARRHMRKESGGHLLQTTALVHEAYVRLVGAELPWQDRVHFFSVASTTMRRVLVDHARAQRRDKRGGGAGHLPLDEELVGGSAAGWDIVDLDLALAKLEKLAPRQVRALELRYFGGLTHAEAARALEISETTVRRDIRLAQSWLRREMSAGTGS